MLTRIFRVVVTSDMPKEFERDFLSVSVLLVRSHAGLVSVHVGRPTEWTPEEYVMITIWNNKRNLVDIAGDHWNPAVIPAGMEKYSWACRYHHYVLFGESSSIPYRHEPIALP